MSTSELTPAAAERVAGVRLPRWALMRWCALALYFAALALWSTSYGIPVQRELVILWICGALVCASLGRSWRQVRLLLLDWLPIAAVLCAYDYTRGAADSLGIGTHVHPMIDFDRFLFLGQTPTEWLQAHLYDPSVLSGWNVAFTLVYTSYFIVPFALAGILWARDRLAFLAFARRLVSLAFAGLATYMAFPAAPPWMAAESGLLEGVQRTTSNGWQVIGGRTAGLFDEGQAAVNLVAAVPSLHAAFTALVAMFLWGRARRRWRPLLLAYPLAMGLTLIATGEHYFFDVLLGWIYAAAVMVAWAGWERRRARGQPPDPHALCSPEGDKVHGGSVFRAL